MLYAFVWVIPWRLNFICQRFGTSCLFLPHRRVYKIQTPRNYPEESKYLPLLYYKKYNSFIVIYLPAYIAVMFMICKDHAGVTLENSLFPIYCIKLPTSLSVWELQYSYLHEL